MTPEKLQDVTRVAIEAWTACAGSPKELAQALSPEARLAVSWLGQECERLSRPTPTQEREDG